MGIVVDEIQEALKKITENLQNAMGAEKCWPCGCFQDTVDALQKTPEFGISLAPLLDECRSLFAEQRYDCLGCKICWPADAINVAAEQEPSVMESDHCPTQEPVLREGWPPLPGDYKVIRYKAPVAVCTLNSDDLMRRLADTHARDISIVGNLHTENLGIEHMIRNVLPNPHVRFLMVCGEDTRKAIGHLPGQSLVSLMRYGLDENMRIRKALGKRPVIKNVSREHVENFRLRVQVLDLIGETDLKVILETVAIAAANDPGPVHDVISGKSPVPAEPAVEPKRLVVDPKGYFVIYPDSARHLLMLEHYTNNGVLHRVFESPSPTALVATVIEKGLISRLDHAAYLGFELARASDALATGTDFVQDRAPGELE
jgi:tetrahydromethanopterin S-methyltransferase subunit A